MNHSLIEAYIILAGISVETKGQCEETLEPVSILAGTSEFALLFLNLLGVQDRR